MNSARRTFGFLGTTAVAVLAGTSGSVFAQSCTMPKGNFGVVLDVGAPSPGCGSASAATADEFFDKLQSNGLKSISSHYSDTSPAALAINFNRLNMSLAYPTNGTALSFSIPALHFSQTFQGATRDASQDLLEDFLKKNNIIGQIMNYQAQNSPTSPITGAGGMLSSATAGDFNQNFTDSATNIAAPASVAAAGAANGGASNNLIGIALQYSSLTAQDSKTKVVSLPLSYTWRNDIDPRRQLTFSMPLTQVDVDGAKSYIAGLGVAYRVPMNDNWTLTPGYKLSGVGSVDLATVAAMHTLAVTSTYIWDMGSYAMAMGNMVSYNSTMKFKSGDYSFDPGVKSIVLRNGGMLSQPVTWGGQKLSLEYSLIDTRYTGSTKPYADNTQEIGVTVGTSKNAFSARTFLRGGLTYLRGRDTKGFTVNMGYWF